MSERYELLFAEGTAWCWQKSKLSKPLFYEKYKAGNKCYLSNNQSDRSKINVFDQGGNIIGFLPVYVAEQFLAFKKNHSCYRCEIHESNTLCGDTFYIKVIPMNKKNNTDIENVRTIRNSNPTPILRSTSLRAKHPISGLAFASKRKVQVFFDSMEGITGIYCIYSKYFTTYIGQSRNVGARLKEHFKELTKGKHHNSGLQREWKALGESQFTFYLIERCSYEELDDLEAFYIAKYQTYSFGYNQTPDGQKNIAFIGSGIRPKSPLMTIDKIELADQAEPLDSQLIVLQLGYLEEQLEMEHRDADLSVNKEHLPRANQLKVPTNIAVKFPSSTAQIQPVFKPTRDKEIEGIQNNDKTNISNKYRSKSLPASFINKGEEKIVTPISTTFSSYKGLTKEQSNTQIFELFDNQIKSLNRKTTSKRWKIGRFFQLKFGSYAKFIRELNWILIKLDVSKIQLTPTDYETLLFRLEKLKTKNYR